MVGAAEGVNANLIKHNVEVLCVLGSAQILVAEQRFYAAIDLGFWCMMKPNEGFGKHRLG